MGNRSEKIVYFAAAIRGDRSARETIREVIAWVKGRGIRVLAEHVGDENIVDNHLPAGEIERRDIAWLDQATHVVAEISGASTGVGREIEYARTKGDFGKTPAKVLCLYHKDQEFSASPMVRGMDSARYPNVKIGVYRDIGEMESIIERFLES